MPSSPKSPTMAAGTSTSTAAAPATAAPAVPAPIAPPHAAAAVTTANPSSTFQPLAQHATNPHFQELMARIRRAEKFGGAVSDADRTMYRQFKFGTFKAPKKGTAAAATGAGGAASKRGEVPKTTASPAGKTATASGATSKKSAGGTAAAAGKKTGSQLDGVSDEDRLARLKRAHKFGLASTPEIEALEAWYLGKFGEPFTLGKH